jgi:hypothetical protein
MFNVREKRTTFLKESVRALLLRNKVFDLEIWQVGAKFWDVRCTWIGLHILFSFRTVLFSYEFAIIRAHFSDLFWVLIRVVDELAVFLHLLDYFIA